MAYSALRKRDYPTLLEQPDRFWRKVDRRGADECWPWMGCVDAKGYGRAGKKATTAHRIAFLVSGGELAEGLMVLHSCDNPPCCNPAHLRAGTAADNSRDCVERGRHFTPFRRVA